MEVALGCLMVTFGGRGMFRLRRLLALHGYSTDTQTIQLAQSLLKPYAKMELKLISRLIQRGEEDETEADIFSSVKKLLNHGQLEPIPFGQMVSQKTLWEIHKISSPWELGKGISQIRYNFRP